MQLEIQSRRVAQAAHRLFHGRTAAIRVAAGTLLASALLLGACGSTVLSDLQGTCGGATPPNIDITAANHFQFPLSGSHDALACNTCHGGAPDWTSTFTCVCCHAHDQAKTDGQHAPDGGSVPGYVFNSRACYACHTGG
jgi:hypothetical protein